jgi:multimeric flavodoxin WrbA
MNKKEVEKLLKGIKPHPIFKDLPEELKDEACFAGIEERIAKAMFSDHTHKTIKGFAGCKRCRDKTAKRREILKELGFTSYEQYLTWKRVMDVIINDRGIKVA